MNLKNKQIIFSTIISILAFLLIIVGILSLNIFEKEKEQESRIVIENYKCSKKMTDELNSIYSIYVEDNIVRKIGWQTEYNLNNKSDYWNKRYSINKNNEIDNYIFDEENLTITTKLSFQEVEEKNEEYDITTKEQYLEMFEDNKFTCIKQ